jgi:hypothetical protein
VYCGVLWCIVVYCGVLWCIVVYCGVLWCIVVYCGVLWCIVVYLIIMLYYFNAINHPNLMGACRSCGQFNTRLHIPVFRNLFFGSKKTFLTGFLSIFFFLRFPEDFFTGTWFWRGRRKSVFFRFYRNFSQEFLWAGIPVFTQDSSGFLRIPVHAKSCLA